MNDNTDFETALQQLETIVKKLETGNVGLSESIKLYEEGIHLSNFCSKTLEEAKQKVEVIKNSNYLENEFDKLSEENNEF